MSKKVITKLCGVIAFLCLTTVFCYADDLLKSPWEAPRKALFARMVNSGSNEQRETSRKTNPAQIETNPAKIPFLWMLRFYQNFISPIDGEKCGMYPTCSAYSAQAIKKHGATIGLMMTVDRLIHEGTEQETAPYIEKYGVLRYYDPLENNDFWLTDEK